MPSSWSTWEDEMAQNIPYPQWNYPGHEIHQLQWQLTQLVTDLPKSVPGNAAGYPEARHLLDEGLHSDHFWWASCRPWWDTGMIERGADRLFDVASQLKEEISAEKFQHAESLRNLILSTARRWQETGEASRRKEEYLREHAKVTSELTFGKENPA